MYRCKERNKERKAKENKRGRYEKRGIATGSKKVESEE